MSVAIHCIKTRLEILSLRGVQLVGGASNIGLVRSVSLDWNLINSSRHCIEVRSPLPNKYVFSFQFVLFSPFLCTDNQEVRP